LAPPHNRHPPKSFYNDVARRSMIRHGHKEAARLLLLCYLDLYEVDVEPGEDWEHVVTVRLKGPEEAYRILGGPYYHFQSDVPPHPFRAVVRQALQGNLPMGWRLYAMAVFPGVNLFDPTWRYQLLEMTQGTKANNQGAEDFANKTIVWNDLRFRSESERRIAAALDREGVLFLPNCRARVGPAGKRQNREGDFLVCQEGKWGILEVDGEPFHPPSRKSQEDERDRLFKQHGVRVVEHFDAARCYETPIEVVKQFLAILKQS
jgi:hypothetical protein